MELATVFDLIRESFFVLLVFTVFLVYVTTRGRQALINLIFGLYLGLFFTQNAPISIIRNDGTLESAFVSLVLFVSITVGATVVVSRIMPLPFREKKSESLGKKIFLVTAATILVMLYSFHILPIEQLVSIQSPISSIWRQEDAFFWWLVVPFLLLYFHK